jgi:hypothetical protein
VIISPALQQSIEESLQQKKTGNTFSKQERVFSLPGLPNLRLDTSLQKLRCITHFS